MPMPTSRARRGARPLRSFRARDAARASASPRAAGDGDSTMWASRFPEPRGFTLIEGMVGLVILTVMLGGLAGPLAPPPQLRRPGEAAPQPGQAEGTLLRL